MDKFQNKYRNASARAPFWDYGRNAAYFVTICTKNRTRFFGDVQNGEMILSEIGKIAHDCWNEIPEHFPFVKLDVFVVMPDHVHGIIVIDKPDDGFVGTQNFASQQQNFASQQQNFASLQQQPMNRFGPQSKNLASIVRGFKIGIAKNARMIDSDFAWQSRFHDHIIRDDKSFRAIAAYIANNPAKWGEL